MSVIACARGFDSTLSERMAIATATVEPSAS